ncbi:hypothetical protein CW304_11365 [Bacillus sp. UFRGS-B20]|nr:hypothetical protein CW304_11365 [Bacillus sp. UFRGS-B20]
MPIIHCFTGEAYRLRNPFIFFGILKSDLNKVAAAFCHFLSAFLHFFCLPTKTYFQTLYFFLSHTTLSLIFIDPFMIFMYI